MGVRALSGIIVEQDVDGLRQSVLCVCVGQE